MVSLTDASGQVVNSYTYDPWGAPLTVSETVPNPFRYASYHYDTSTELYYLHHRYYDPELRRFLTLDPVGGLVARPTSFNLYLYCVDNPLAYVDPTGLFWDFVIDLGFAAYDIYEAFAGGWKSIGTNLAALGADLGSAIVPGFSGGGAMVRIANKADDAYEAGRVASRAGGKVDEAVEAAGAGGKHTPDQEAFKDIVKEATNRGHTSLSPEDAKTIGEWGREVQYPGFSDDPSHLADPSHWVGGPHIHVPGVGSGHIPVR